MLGKCEVIRGKETVRLDVGCKVIELTPGEARQLASELQMATIHPIEGGRLMTEKRKRKAERMQVVPGDGCNRVEWTECKLADITTGDVFRFWEPGQAGGWEPHIDPFGAYVFVAVADAEPVLGSLSDAWGVQCSRADGFEAMDWSL